MSRGENAPAACGLQCSNSGAFLNCRQSDGSGKLGLKEFYVLWTKIQQYQVRTQEGPRQGRGICGVAAPCLDLQTQ